MEIEDGVYVMCVLDGRISFDGAKAAQVVNNYDVVVNELVESAKRAPGRFMAMLVNKVASQKQEPPIEEAKPE